MGYVKGETVLPEGAGYGIVIGFGLFFSVVTVGLSKLEERLMGTRMTSEFFNTAGRTIKTGLTASVLVSQWTWAATLLQSSNVAWKYGVSGPFWYAAGASIQVVLFGILAIEVKRKAPNCHTFLELIDARYGTVAHIVFFVFALLTNIVVTSMLLLGGAATVSMLTGMDINAAAFLIPLGTIAYTLIGGLKATFLASYVHSTYLYVALLVLAFTVYAGSPVVNPVTNITSTGDAQSVYEGLMAAVNASYDRANQTPSYGPISGNEGGSLLTMDSEQGLMFGMINIVGNFGTVFVDQSYWQSAIAAKPSSAVAGFFIGGLCWFAIPFTMATTMGLAARAVGTQLVVSDADQGLVPPAVAVDLLGTGGAVLVLIMLFMAVTSTGSAELIAVSSLGTYDFYRKYINPEATGEQLLRVSKYFVIGFGLFMGCLALILQEIGLSLGWVYLFMGILIGSAVVPVALTITWSKTTRNGCIAGAVLGLITAIPAWIVAAHVQSGKIDVDTLGTNEAMLTGNLFAICLSGVVCIGVSLFEQCMGWQTPYDFETMKNIRLVDDKQPELDPEETDPEMLNKAFKCSWIVGGIMFVMLLIVWPIPMHAAHYVFTEGFFTFWVIVAITWGFVAALIIIIMPVAESVCDVWRALCAEHPPEGPDGVQSPPSERAPYGGKAEAQQDGPQGPAIEVVDSKSPGAELRLVVSPREAEAAVAP